MLTVFPEVTKVVKVAGNKIICNNCDSEMSKETGYYLCTSCGWRFYGDVRTDPYDRRGCPKCGIIYLKTLHFCPNCGAPNTDD